MPVVAQVLVKIILKTFPKLYIIHLPFTNAFTTVLQ